MLSFTISMSSNENFCDFRAEAQQDEEEEDDSQEEIEEGPVPSVGAVGLANLGSTCYMNVVMQTLASLQTLVSFFSAATYRQEQPTNSPYKGKLVQKFAQLISVIWSGEMATVSPHKLQEVIEEHHRQFRRDQPQDAQEFFLALLQGLHVELNDPSASVRLPSSIYPQADQSSSNYHRAEMYWHDFCCKNRSIIIDQFHGQLRSDLVCAFCSLKHSRFETFTCLSLSLSRNPDKLNLLHSLRAFGKPDRLIDYTCTYCSSTSTVFKSMKVWRVPPVLLLHLNRFQWRGQRSSKRQSQVTFPAEELSLEWLVEGPHPEHVALVYELQAVVEHQGCASSGHYVVFCRHQPSSCWLLLDDRRVHRVPLQRVLAAQAYLLLYCARSIS